MNRSQQNDFYGYQSFHTHTHTHTHKKKTGHTAYIMLELGSTCVIIAPMSCDIRHLLSTYVRGGKGAQPPAVARGKTPQQPLFVFVYRYAVSALGNS